MEKQDIKRYGVLVVGITLSLGFAFGAVQSFSSMVDAPEAQQGGQEEVQLPDERLTNGSFDLGPQEQQYLAATQNAVFVNLYYETDEQKQDLETIQEDLDSNFGETVYVAVVDEEENDVLMVNFGVDEMPGYVVIGSSQEPQRDGEGDINYQQVATDVCDVMASWDEHAGYCQSL